MDSLAEGSLGHDDNLVDISAVASLSAGVAKYMTIRTVAFIELILFDWRFYRVHY